MRSHVWKRNQTDPLTMADDVLYTRLEESIEWTTAMVERDDCRPSMRYLDLRWRILNYGIEDTVCEVGSARQKALSTSRSAAILRCPDLRGGRLMVYFPAYDLCDGAAEQASAGFFDGFNVPPWETWIGYFESSSEGRPSRHGYLLAYVPQKLLALADAGISVNPEQCIQWLSQTSLEMRSRFPVSGASGGPTDATRWSAGPYASDPGI
jgi:hypothetical protein